jgi:hypothetical protein
VACGPFLHDVVHNIAIANDNNFLMPSGPVKETYFFVVLDYHLRNSSRTSSKMKRKEKGHNWKARQVNEVKIHTETEREVRLKYLTVVSVSISECELHLKNAFSDPAGA